MWISRSYSVTLFNLIMSDFRRYTGIECSHQASPMSRLRHALFWYGFHATMTYRIGHALEEANSHPLQRPFFWCAHGVYRLLKSFITLSYGIDIDRRAKIGEGFYIGHFGGISIGHSCTLGACCSINQQATIASPREYSDGHTLIGHNVWIGGHARIHPGVCIGDNATVGVGANVTSDIPENALATGNPARVVNRWYPNAHLLGTTRHPL